MEFNPQNQQIHLLGLNDQQRDAVLCHDNIVYVSAGPGTGKTHMLTSKLIDYIVSSEAPQKIVALSYTNSAAHQLGERFNRKVRECGVTKDYTFFNGTIHSFCYRMMKQFGEDTFDYVILDDDELNEIAQEIEQHYQGKYSKQKILSVLRVTERADAGELAKEVSSLKDALKIISIQDILLRFIQMIDSNPSFQQWLQEQVTVLAIDEAQDLTQLNFTIFDRMLSVIPQMKLFIVGDPRQNIFEFNGGSYEHLEEFLSLYPMHVKKDLTITYRCSRAISDYVNQFAFADCSNPGLEPLSGEPGEIEISCALNEEKEAEGIVDSISRVGDLSSCAVLCNNVRSMDSVIHLLQERGMPYKVLGGKKSLKRHIRFLNHVLRIIDSDNAYSIRKVAEYAGIDIQQGGHKKRSKFYASELGGIIARIREETSGLQFSSILTQVLLRIMRDPGDTDEVSRDYDELLDLSGLYETTADYLISFSTDKERFAQFYAKDYDECPFPVEDKYLTISTIHSAKGLEWDHVYIMGLSEGIFPNPYFAQGLSPEKKDAFFNSELKKMYVAATRARKGLHLSYPKAIFRNGFVIRKNPSRFVISLIKTGRDSTVWNKPFIANRFAGIRPSA